MGALIGAGTGAAQGPIAIVTQGRRQVHPRVSIEWSRTIAVDVDARQVQTRVAIRLAQYFRDCLLAGVHHVTGAPTKRDPDGTPIAVHTGWMARHWVVGAARGSRAVATVELKVNTADRGRVIAARRWPLLQSAEGRAGDVMRRAFTEAIALSFPTPTTRQVPTGGGTVDVLEGTL